MYKGIFDYEVFRDAYREFREKVATTGHGYLLPSEELFLALLAERKDAFMAGAESATTSSRDGKTKFKSVWRHLGKITDIGRADSANDPAWDIRVGPTGVRLRDSDNPTGVIPHVGDSCSVALALATVVVGVKLNGETVFELTDAADIEARCRGTDKPPRF